LPSRSHPAPIQPVTTVKKRRLASSGQTSTTTSVVQHGGITKPKQSKSRNGCITCKGKRLKCDESKPTCEQCRKRNVQCGGYTKAFKWRSFEEANFTGKSGPKPKKGRYSKLEMEMHALLIIHLPVLPVSPPPPPSPLRKVSVQAQSHSSPSNDSISETPNEFQHPPLLSSNAFHEQYQTPARSTGLHTAMSPHFPNPNDYIPPSPVQNVYHPQAYIDSYALTTLCNVRSNSNDISQPRPIHPPRHPHSFPSGSPSLRDILLPGTDMNSPPPPIELRPPQSPLPYMPSGYTPPADSEMGVEDDEDVEEIVRSDEPAMKAEYAQRGMTNNWSLRLASASPSPSESSSSSTSSAMDLWAQPRLAANSKEMLLVQFDRQTCGILSVKDGPNENPWRTVLWPMAHDSKHLFHAIAALTAFHSSKVSPELRMDGMRHMHKSVTKLATSLHDMKFDGQTHGNEIEAALATTLVLAFSESWDRHVSTGIKHLKGAKYFVNQAVVQHQQAVQAGRSNAQQSHRLKFLCNSFIYMDVIARLTSLEEDDMDDLDNVLATFNQPFDDMSEIDPLMGAASTLFPLIGRVAAIVTRVRKSETNSFIIISDAIELKRRIEQWQLPKSANFEIPEDPTSEVQHSLQTAEAYRWATLLYLHEAVPEIPSEPATILASRVLKYLATVPLSSRAIIVQIFPLLAASCEAVTQEDRRWVSNRWGAMSARMSIGNVDRCFDVIKEVWDRRDSFEAAKTERFLRRQAARGLGTNELSSANSMRGTKRKSSDADSMDSDVFFNDSLCWAPGSFGGGSLSKRRAMTDQNGLPQAIQIADGSMTSSTNMDVYGATMMQPPQAPQPPQSPQPPMQPPWALRSPLALQSPMRKRSNDTPLENMEAEYTVRGRLHWIGVMKDFDWEGDYFPLVSGSNSGWRHRRRKTLLTSFSAAWVIYCPVWLFWHLNFFHCRFWSFRDCRFSQASHLVWPGKSRGLQYIAPVLSRWSIW
jgi:Fungal specific transcription factor domain/Fungal Zn(2)-Cys(6) binuclear cluster domain